MRRDLTIVEILQLILCLIEGKDWEKKYKGKRIRIVWSNYKYIRTTNDGKYSYHADVLNGTIVDRLAPGTEYEERMGTLIVGVNPDDNPFESSQVYVPLDDLLDFRARVQISL